MLEDTDSNLAPKYLSREAIEELEKELEFLTVEKRKEISEKLNESSSLGDLSENAEYHDAKDQQLMNEQRIAQIEDILSRSMVVSGRKTVQVKVELGCVVTLKKIRTSEVYEYHLVGSDESNPSANKISNESPLGLSLMDKKKGEKVKVNTPTGGVMYVIMKIT
jgi:transcription elongation factor GreA